MIKERYVNFEVANLLRDKGFNEPCRVVYEGKNLSVKTFSYINSELTSDYVCAPTQATACDWVEETFNIAILLELTIKGYMLGFIHAHKDPNTATSNVLGSDGKSYIPMPCGDNSDGSWSSKELAYNAALKYVLTNVI